MTPNLTRLRERFDADPRDRVAFEALEEHYYVGAQWAELIPLYEAHLEAHGDTRPASERARLLYRLGQALEDGLGEIGRATEAFRAARDLDPQFVPVLRRLRALAVESRSFDEAIDGLLADPSATPECVASLLQIGERALEANETAPSLRAFEQALARAPHEPRALIGVARAHERAERLNEAAAAWERAIGAVDGPQRGVAFEALGNLLAEQLADLDGALHIFQRASAEQPEEPRWLDRLAELLLRLERFEAAVALAARRLELTSDPARRSAIALETGRILLDRLHAPADARPWLERAAEGREDGAAHMALAEAAGRCGDAPGRLFHLERAMELGAEIPEWSDLGIAEEDDSNEPIASLRRAADERPDDPDALDALATRLAARGEHAERVAVLERRAALASCEPGERAECWLEIGEVRAGDLADAAGAADAYRRAVECDPERALGLDALEETLRSLGRLHDLGDALAASIAAAHPRRRAALLARVGHAALEAGNASDAVAQFRAALDSDPGHARSLAGLARAAEAAGDERTLFDAWNAEAARCAPERLAELARAALDRAQLGDEPELALPILRCWADRAPSRDSLEALASVLAELGRSDDLAAVAAALDAHLDGPARAAQRRQLAYLHAADGNAGLAASAWREALAHDPDDVASFEALATALAEAGDDGELIAVCESRPAHAPRSPLADSLYGQALERRGRLEDASAVLASLATTGAADAAALATLERVARAAGDPAALAAVLRRQIERCEDPDLRDRLCFERAELLDVALADPEAARPAYAAVESNARDGALRSRAAVQLDALLEQSGAFAELCDRLAARAEAGAADAPALHVRVADLAEHRLGDPARARRHLEAALRIDASQDALWRRLAALATDPHARLRALEGELATDPARERRLALELAVARLAIELGDVARAGAAYQAVLAIAPAEPEAHAFWTAELERAGRFDELAELLRTRLAAEPRDEVVTTPLRLRLADVYARHLDRLDEAAAVLTDARREGAPLAAIADPLADLLTRLNRDEECAELCEAASLDLEDPAEAARLLDRAARAASVCDDETRAVRCLRRALELEPSSRERRVALAGLLRGRGDDAALIGLLEAELSEPGADALALHCELVLRCAALGRTTQACDHAIAAASLAPFDASLREPALDRAAALGRDDDSSMLLATAAEDPRSEQRADLWRRHAESVAPRDVALAVDSYAAALALDPDRADIRRARRELLERAGRVAEALVDLEREIECAAGDERAIAIAHGADLALRAHGAAEALPWLARLVAEAPTDPAVWRAIADRLHRAGATRLEERALREAERGATHPGEIAALARERAVLLEGPLADPGRALAAWRSALAIDPADPATLAALDRIYTATDRPREALRIVEARAARAHGPSRAQLLHRAARLADALGEVERAASHWREVLATPGLDAATRASCLAPAFDAQQRAGAIDTALAIAEEELTTTSDPSRANALRRTLARGWRDERARPDRALPFLRALVDSGDAEPEDEASLRDLLRASGAYAELATRLASRVAAQPDDQASWHELAVLREETLWDASGAGEAWRALARLAPESPAALAGVRRASQRAGDPRALEAALEREIALGLVDAAPAWRRVGRIRREILRDLAGAERAYEASLAIEASNLESLAALRELAEARADWRRALDLGAREIACTAPADGKHRRSLWLHRADRAMGPARDLACAASAFEHADALGALSAPDLAAWACVLRELGSAERWREVFARACDHPDAKTDAKDQLALAHAFADAGQPERAAERVRGVLAQDPDHAGAWALSARLRELAGDAEGASSAWSHAAESSTGLDAARAWRAAAAPFETAAPTRALALLARAVESYPSFAPAHAARAIVAERLGHDAEAVIAAKSALEGRGVTAPLLRDEHRDAARAGSRAAHRLEQWSDAWELAAELLALVPNDADGLLAQGMAARHLGSAHAARRALEAWLATEPASPLRGAPLVALGDALVDLGETDAALARYEEALAIDPTADAAHAAIGALHERLERCSEAAEAWARWAEATSDATARADRFVRAARIADASAACAGPWLRRAIESRPDHATAWLELLAHLRAHGSEDQRLAAATEGAAQLDDASAAARLEVERARILETRGATRDARAAFVRAVELDATLEEAAWSAARLLRDSGDWAAAADCLALAAARHPEPTERAALLAERGRLCAGPLEDLVGALAAYQEACQLAPDRADLREALAGVYAQRTEGRDRARSELLVAIAMDPVRPTAWRRLVRILREEGRDGDADQGLALLRALGAATSSEREAAPDRISFPIGAASLEDPVGETLREAFLGVAGDWAEAIGEPESFEPAALDSNVARLAQVWRATRAERGGPALASLAVEQYAAHAEALVWTALGAAATVEASRETRQVVDKVSGRALRRLRRGLAELDAAVLRRFDFVEWTVALRALALARAVDQSGGDLRAGLCCARADAVRAADAPLPPEADLTPFAASAGTARLLLVQAVRAWLARL